ncbi:MAG: hypothetical protein Q4B28_04125 [bacterium]|nr:hypothetical protein [bacterium]
MFFHLTGLKDISDKNYTLEVLIEADDIAIVKSFLEAQKVITLGLEIYKGEVDAFGRVYFLVKYQETVLRIVAKFEDLEDSLRHAIELGLEVMDANYLGAAAQDPVKIQQMIARIREQHVERLAQEQARKAQAQQDLNLNFNDKKLQRAYQAIDDIINQIDQLFEIGGDQIEPLTRKKLDDMRGNISKLRLATNYDKIIEELHITMNLIVATQDFLLERLSADKVFSIAAGSKVSNVEVIREQTRLAKSKLLYTLGAQLSREETMYVSLGYLKLLTQYLHKDISFALENKLLFCRQLFKGIEVLTIFVLLELVLLAVFAPLLKIELSLQRFGIMFMYVAVLGALVGVFNAKIKPSSVAAYGFWTVLIAACYVGLMYGIKVILLF